MRLEESWMISTFLRQHATVTCRTNKPVYTARFCRTSHIASVLSHRVNAPLAFLVCFFMTCLRSQCLVRIFGLKPLSVGLKSPATVAKTQFVIGVNRYRCKHNYQAIDRGRQTQATAILGIDRGSHFGRNVNHRHSKD